MGPPPLRRLFSWLDFMFPQGILSDDDTNFSCLNHSLELAFCFSAGREQHDDMYRVVSLLNILFRFYNGGLVFSAVTFVLIAAISLYSFLLLVKTKFVVSGSFGGGCILNFALAR